MGIFSLYQTIICRLYVACCVLSGDAAKSPQHVARMRRPEWSHSHTGCPLNPARVFSHYLYLLNLAGMETWLCGAFKSHWHLICPTVERQDDNAIACSLVAV